MFERHYDSLPKSILIISLHVYTWGFFLGTTPIRTHVTTTFIYVWVHVGKF
jgi:hypothetical protein